MELIAIRLRRVRVGVREIGWRREEDMVVDWVVVW
jgi:hypothetical protein